MVEKRNSVVYGTGFIALDAIYGLDQHVPQVVAGGTCGNVLVSLAYLGWKAYPVGRLADDGPGKLVRADLANWSVQIDHLGLSPTAPTPIVIERISRTRRGVLKHRFEFNCPGCGVSLPSFRPVREDSIGSLIPTLGRADVFFCDRVSAGIVKLAEHFHREGTLIIFEPCGTGDEKHFKKMLDMADIVKYSHDRAASFLDILLPANPPLQIETLGEGGLQYCSRLKNRRRSVWQRIDAFELPEFRDSAGAGDWCTAGIIQCLGNEGRDAFMRKDDRDIRDALRYAQAVAAWNCEFEGARGGMYQQTRSKFNASVTRILAKSPEPAPPKEQKVVTIDSFDLCPGCKQFTGQALAADSCRHATAHACETLHETR